MGQSWKRNVAVAGTAPNQYLELTVPSGGNPSGRNDSADDITVYTSDRANGAADVQYTLTGTSGTMSIENKDGSGTLPTGFSVSTAGNTLTIDDGEDAADGIEFSYYLKLGEISTTDPMIHNQSDPGLD